MERCIRHGFVSVNSATPNFAPANSAFYSSCVCLHANRVCFMTTRTLCETKGRGRTGAVLAAVVGAHGPGCRASTADSTLLRRVRLRGHVRV